MTKIRYNLDSPNTIQTPCDLRDVEGWCEREASALTNEAIRRVVMEVVANLEHFVSWPQKAILLWKGCTRGPRKYHKYPQMIKNLAKYADLRKQTLALETAKTTGAQPSARCCRITLDTRINGPAIAAFEMAGGVRPRRFGSNNAWSVHHLYSGKFPYPGQTRTLHAAKDSGHFTQSSGLVSVHPIADQMCDEFPLFAWFLRAKAFQKFGYDPDAAFSREVHDAFGFVGAASIVVPLDESNRERSEEET